MGIELTREQKKGLEGLARREAFQLSEKPLTIEPPTPWEARGITVEEFLKETATSLFRATLSLDNAEPEYLVTNYKKVLTELSKVVETSGYFLIKKESDKIKGIMSSLTQQLERLQNGPESVDEERKSPSSSDQG